MYEKSWKFSKEISYSANHQSAFLELLKSSTWATFSLATPLDQTQRKLAAVEEWPVPESITQVRSFLGFANYFRKFIPRFAERAQPLDEVTGRHAEFSRNKKRQDAFDSLKSSLLCAPVLQLPDVSKPFRVHTDASDLAIAAVLEQERDSAWHPVAYTSRKLTSAEWTLPLPNEKLSQSFLPWHHGSCTCSNILIFLQTVRL